VIRDFSGSEIRVVELPDLGTLVSVTLLLTIDSGSTTFTLLLPRVNLPAPPALLALVPVTTEAITTFHSLFPAAASSARSAGVLYGHPPLRDSRLNGRRCNRGRGASDTRSAVARARTDLRTARPLRRAAMGGAVLTFPRR